MPPPTRGHGRDRGSASIWVLAAAGIVAAVAAVTFVRVDAVLARHRVEAAADLAALAAAGQIGVSADGCGVAALVATRNGTNLITCVLSLAADGRSGTVRVRVRATADLLVVGRRPVVAGARAGREQAPVPARTTG